MDERSPVVVALCTSIFLLFLAVPGLAETITVPGGSQDAIQDAVDQAGPSGTVILAKGDHVVTQTVFVRTNGVRILGKNGSEIVIDAGEASGLLPVFEVTASQVEISDVTVWASPEGEAEVALVVADGADLLEVSGCRGDGIAQLVNVADSYDVSIRRNRAEVPGAPDAAVILVEGGGDCRVEKNQLTGYRTEGAAGISVVPFARSTFRISGNQITGFDTGIAVDGEGVAEIRKNRISSSTNGMILAATTPAILWEIRNNRVEETLAAGIYLEDGRNCVVTRNRVVAAGTDGINVGGIQIEVTWNACRLCAGYGIYVEATHCDVSHCKTNRNGKGVRVVGSSNRLQRMRARKNVGDGIVAVPATTGALGNVDAGGNRSSDNGGVQISIT